MFVNFPFCFVVVILNIIGAQAFNNLQQMTPQLNWKRDFISGQTAVESPWVADSDSCYQKLSNGAQSLQGLQKWVQNGTNKDLKRFKFYRSQARRTARSAVNTCGEPQSRALWNGGREVSKTPIVGRGFTHVCQMAQNMFEMQRKRKHKLISSVLCM